MDKVTPADRDTDIDPADAPNAHHASDAPRNGTTPQTDTPTVIKQEDQSVPVHDDDDGGVIERPAKRRRVEDTTPHRSVSRAISPPWKSFSANGPTTVFENGVRKSSRVNRETAPPTPEPVKRNSRHAAKATQTNGTPQNGVKRESRNASSAAKTKATPALAKKASAASLATPARKSERQRRGAALAQTSSPASPAHQKTFSEEPRKRSGRSRRTRQASPDDGDSHDPEAGLYASPDGSAPAPRLRLKFCKPDPPNRHPQHAPPKTDYTSIDEWLAQDDPLESEETQRITQEKAREEAERRLQIVDAAEHGVLSEARCSIFAPEPAPGLPLQYSHWDHVVSHALTFNKLLKEEKIVHRRVAKTLAREAYEFWKNKFKRKSQEEIDKEEEERQITRYRQLVKDVKDAWGLVKVEIDKERVAKWEEEQLQLGQRAMDDMFTQAKEILGRNVNDGASSLMSEDRDFDEDDFASATSDLPDSGKDDDIMSSSSDSEQENQEDEDANLTADQLRAKYEQLPDLPDSSSDVEADEDEDDEDDDDDDDENERTPAPTPDPELDDNTVRSLPPNPFTHSTNGVHDHDDSDAERKPDYIDPATVELEQVDEALLDSEDEDKASGSGSEAWSSDAESEADDDNDDETGNSDAESNEESEGDDMGMMGFLAPKDIKKLKEAAKTAIDDPESESIAPTVEETNGHGPSPARDIEDQKHVNGHAHTADEKEQHVNGNSERPRTSQSVEKVEPSGEGDVVQGTSVSRSRHASSPARTEVPFLLRGTLREYQHDGLDWLANLYESETNGILADEMGLGKTIQTISLLAYLAVRREIWGPHLVVVPTSVMLNWEMEFKKFLPGFKILTYYGDINERKRKRMGWRNTGKDMYNVVITSYQLILQDAAAFKMRPWQYLVLDEAHNIKNFKSQRWQTMLNLRTQRRLLLTGTPLQNNIDELWSLLYFLMPAGFAGEGRIAGLEEFTMALKNPTSQILDQGRQQLDAEAQKIVKKLHEVLRPYLLRRLKSEVEKQMPGKYEHVVYCKLSKRQRQLYDGFMGRASTKEILSSGNYMSIINCLMSLRKVCNHPDLFETRAIVTSMAMPKSVAAQFEIKDLLIRKRMQEGMEDKQVNLDALHLLFARREQTLMGHAKRFYPIRATRPLKDLIERQTRRLNEIPAASTTSIQSAMSAMARREQVAVRDHLQTCLNLTRSRTQFLPIYGKDCIEAVKVDWHGFTFGAIDYVKPKADIQPLPQYPRIQPANQFQPSSQFGQAHVHYKGEPTHQEQVRLIPKRGKLGFRSPRSVAAMSPWQQGQITHFYGMIPTLEERAESLEPLISRFTCVTPAVAAEELVPISLSKRGVDLIRSSPLVRQPDPFHSSRIRQSIAFPDKRLLQYDCGKLQRLATLLRDLQAGGHRALIFTQMTKVLDILEQFLNIHGHRYLRLDGSTKIEQRQILTDRFNSDPKILAFILSSRSGGLGINLTGADTVIFYDLDWNPAMDKQCQDRAHRIGQTRDVHIYKFVSEYTIEANILRKSNQKRLLDDVIIQKGDFTTDTFNRVTWRDALDAHTPIDTTDEAGAAMERVLGEKSGLLGDTRVMGTVEDTEDLTAASLAQKEIVDEIQEDQVDFNESLNATRAGSVDAGRNGSAAKTGDDVELDAQGNEVDKRHVDEYMLALYREEFGKEPWRPPTDRQKRNRKGQDPHVRHRKRKY